MCILGNSQPTTFCKPGAVVLGYGISRQRHVLKKAVTTRAVAGAGRGGAGRTVREDWFSSRSGDLFDPCGACRPGPSPSFGNQGQFERNNLRQTNA